MRKWQQRSVYWRDVLLGTIYIAGAGALIALWASSGRDGFLLLILPLLGAVGGLSMNLRCPRCGQRVMLFPYPPFVRGWPPRDCQRCKWPTRRAYDGTPKQEGLSSDRNF